MNSIHAEKPSAANSTDDLHEPSINFYLRETWRLLNFTEIWILLLTVLDGAPSEAWIK